MQYVARRELKCVDRNDAVTVYKPGDIIPDFDKWDIHVKRAHLSMELVELAEQEQDEPKLMPAPKPDPKGKKKKKKKAGNVTPAQ